MAQSRAINQLVETLHQQSTQTQAAKTDEEGENEKKMLKIRENFLASEIDGYNPKRPGEWITSVRKLLQTHGISWLEDNEEQQLEEPGVTPELRDMLDAAVTLVAEKTLPIDAKVRLGVHHKSYSINQLLEEFTVKLIDRSGTRQDELRTIATKIKMRRNRDIAEYITKHRILRNDMIEAGCEEIANDTNEARTVQYILQGL